MDVCEPVLALAATDADLVRPMLAIGFVLGLLFLFLFLVRRLAASGRAAGLATKWHRLPQILRRGPRSEGTRDFSVVGQLTLTPTHRAHVLSLRGREVVVVTYPQGCDWFAVENPGGETFSAAVKDARAAGGAR
jgi:hypothetical protein